MTISEATNLGRIGKGVKKIYMVDSLKAGRELRGFGKRKKR